MTSFYYVRHGETGMNTKRHLVGGQSNHTPLTELGSLQANRLGTYLRETGIIPDVVFSSGAVRTNATAEIALRAAGITMDIIEDPRLLEMSQGSVEGMLRDEVYTPENKERYQIETMEGKFPGGESLTDIQRRKRDFLDEKHHEYPESTLLVFGHGLAIRALAGQVRGFTREQILGEETGNVSVTRIDFTNGLPEVFYVGKNVISE